MYRPAMADAGTFGKTILNLLALFDAEEDACDYADKLTMAKEGATVVVVDDAQPGQAPDDISPRA